MQVYAKNFKPKGNKAGSFGYLFQLVRIYELEDVKLLVISTPEKKQRGEDELLVMQPLTKKLLLELYPLE